MEVWPGIPLVQVVVPVRDQYFLGFLGCFRVWMGQGRDEGLVDQYWWCSEGFLRILPRIPMFWAMDPVMAFFFEFLEEIPGSRGVWYLL